jgi:N-carbamoylputrescine amidase
MRVTVCELPHEPRALADAWAALCEHTARQSSELVLLPELAMMEPVWQDEHFDASRWSAAEAITDVWLRRLPELGVAHVVGTRPVTIDGRRLNQGFFWSASREPMPLRSKFYLPDEPGSWEARWFERGDCQFTEYCADAWSFGLNICTELWAVETYAAYARRGVQVILSPRATASATTAKWLSAGVVAAVRSGAFSLSSNRVDPTGACGGIGWIIDPYGTILALTNRDAPFATANIDLATSAAARNDYPCYVFGERRPHAAGVGVW